MDSENFKSRTAKTLISSLIGALSQVFFLQWHGYAFIVHRDDILTSSYLQCKYSRSSILPRNNVVKLNDRPDMTIPVYRGRKATK